MMSQWVMTEAPHINRDSSPLSIFMLFLFKIIQLLVEERHRHYTSTWTHWMKDGPHRLIWLFRKCICFWQLLCRWGTIWQTRWKITDQHQNSTLWPFMEKLRNETDSITYIDFDIVKTIKMNMTRQMKIRTDNGKWELYMTSSMIHMLNTKVQPEFSSWWYHCALQRWSHLQMVYTKETQALWVKALQAVWF